MARGIDKERLKGLLLDLVRISSPSGRERAMCERLASEMRALGAESIEVDDAGEKVGGDSGNLIIRFAGTRPDAPPLLLSAHMDVVPPCEGVRPIVEGDVIRTDGSTVLGGDDKSGCAIIAEVLRVLRDDGLPHGPIDVVFTICEERGLAGAKLVDVSSLRAKTGVVLDSDCPGFLFTRAPGSIGIQVKVHGLEAHAGMAPEAGLNAIQIAAQAISGMRLGRIDHETTANLGIVRGGSAVNVVPNLVEIWGEARSHDETKLMAQVAHMRSCFEEAAARFQVTVAGRRHRARVEFVSEVSYEAMNVPDEARIVQLVVEAGRALGKGVTVTGMGGGCDANIFNRRGLEVANLGTGMREIHTVREWLDVNDMTLAAEILLETVRRNAT